MDFQLERKLAANFWIIKSRWFYILGISLSGFILETVGKYDFPYWLTFSFALSAFLFNVLFYQVARKIKKDHLFSWLSALSFSQIIFELCIFTILFYVSGSIESTSGLFFILPIFSASFVLTVRGSLIVSLLSGILMVLVIFLEGFGIIPHFYRFARETIYDGDLVLSLSTALNHAIFYIVIGIYSGFVVRVFEEREALLKQKTDSLDKETKLRIREAQKTKEEQRKTMTIISTFADPIIFLDNLRKIKLFNPAAREFLGIDKKHMGTQISDRDNFSMNNFKKVITNKYSVKKLASEETEHGKFLEEMTLNKDGQEKIYKIMTAQVCDEKNVCYGYVKVFYDLTREKILDKLKTEFISVAAHQLRTPLSAIKWVIDMVVKGDAGKLNKEQKELLDKAYKSNERIIVLVDDLLNVSRIEEGRFGYNFTKNNFQDVLKIALENNEAAITKKSIVLETKIKGKIPKISMDGEKIVMVLQNLLDNAIKYTPPKGRIVMTVEKKNNDLVFNIKDSGVGIPKKDQAKLFSKFFRADNVVRMETEGTGLGLFIAKNVIEKHGGRIVCNSKEGEGTEFMFTLPVKKIK